MEKLVKIKENEEKIIKIDSDIQDIFDSSYAWNEEDEKDDEEEYIRMINDPHYQANELEQEKRKLLLENRRIRAEIEKDEFSKRFNQESKTYKRGVVASDNESEIDTLSREMHAKILARHIVKKEIQTPINIGVFGEWGEGKSSFIKLIEKEIEYINTKHYAHTSQTYIVRYDASEYDERNKIWASILSILFKKFELQEGLCGKIKFLFNRFCNTVKENLFKYIVNTGILVITITWLVFLSIKDNSFDKIINQFFGVVGIIPMILSITNIFIPFIKQQIKAIQPLSERALSIVQMPNYKKELGARENIKSSLDELIDVWIRKNDERIVLFVDELDRCNGETISGFFDALQLLLSVKGLTVILSINYKTVCYSLANSNLHYFSGDITNEEKMKFGIDYLKKYINIPIYLAVPSNYEFYISNIISKINGADSEREIKSDQTLESMKPIKEEKNKVFTEKEEALINKILNWTNIQSHITPREVKNIINILVISKEVVMMSNVKSMYEQKVDFEKYIRWFLFEYFNCKTAKKIYFKVKMINGDLRHSTFKESIDEKKIEKYIDDSEILSTKMVVVLNNIRIDEIPILYNIAGWFVCRIA